MHRYEIFTSGKEIEEVLGLIGRGVDFDIWSPILPLGTRDVVAIVGSEPVEALSTFYRAEQPTPDLPASCSIPLAYLKQAVAMFTWLRIIPTLDAQHENTGRNHRIGENEKGLTALEQYKDEANIQRMAYEATDALIESLDRGQYKFWTESAKYRQRAGLLISTKDRFDEFYVIGSHRLFVTLLPMIRETQTAYVAPILGRDFLKALLDGDERITPILYETAARALALLTMKKAIERLPVEVLPEGIVQVNQNMPVKQKLKAEKEARNSVAAALGDDATRYLNQLQDLVKSLTEDSQPTDFFVPGPIVHSKGMSF